MKNIFYMLLLAVVTTACADNEKLGFNAFTINGTPGSVNIEVASDGTITSWGKKVGTLGHDGTVTDATGRQTAVLDDKGMLTGLDGNTPLNIDDDGTMHIEGSAAISWSNDGELKKADQKLGYLLKPADAGSYRAASVVLYLYSGLFTR